MASSPSLSLQKAFFELFTSADFQAACGVTVGVYDHVPAKAQAPYVVISDIQEDSADEQGYRGSDLHASITVWSTKPGKVEVHTIADQVRRFSAPVPGVGAAPSAPFSLQDHRLVTWRHLQTIPKDEPDGITSSAIVKLVFSTEPAGS